MLFSVDAINEECEINVYAMKLALLFICLNVYVSFGYRILGILPYKGPSHNMVILPLFDELAHRGHDVHVISYYPKTTPTANYTSLPLKLEPGVKLKGFYRIDEIQPKNPVLEGIRLINLVNLEMESAMMSEHIQMAARAQWDAVIVEYFNTDMFASLAHLTGAPLILFHTSDLLPFQNIALGEPLDPSYIPHAYTGHLLPMTFWDRILNTVEVYYHVVDFYLGERVEGQALAEKYLGPLPEMEEIVKNASLFLVNSHPSFHGSKPVSPFVVQIGGIHLKAKNPLPQDTLQLIEQCENGVIYFSMGSVLSGDSMTKTQMEIFVSAFSSLPVDILWKFEGTIENKPQNIHLRPWLPQRDILGHPKVLLFISHCGLLSIEEALTEGVPVICIPVFGDQFFNARRVETLGNGKAIDLFTVTAQSLRETIKNVLKDPSYKQNALGVKQAFNDRPMSAMDTAVYWVEYVVRHRGAPHLRCPSRYLPLYQLYNLDVWAVLISCLLIIAGAIIFVMKLAFKWLCRDDKNYLIKKKQ